MAWNDLETDIRNEINDLGLETDIEFLEAPLTQRIDRPTLVRGKAIGIGRPVEEYSEDERDG